MLRSVTLTNFKSYRKATLPLEPLTLLIGTNASGKSNAIEGIRLLSWLAKGRRISDITQSIDMVLEGELFLRGHLVALPHWGQTEFSLGCHIDPVTVNGSAYGDLAVSIAMQLKPFNAYIGAESITGDRSRSPLYVVDTPVDPLRSELQVSYNNFAKGGSKPKIPCSNQQAIFTQLETPARFGAEHTKSQQNIPKVVGAFRDALGQVLFLDPIPSRMRGYSFVTDKRLRQDGSNLSAMLYQLVEEQNRLEEVLEFVRLLPELPISGMSFIQTGRGDVMLELKETLAGHDQKWDASLLSDGTLRVLAVAAALLRAERGSVVVIEEIDNGVHPSRARHLLEQINSVAKRRGLRTLLTTHNPALLDALPLEAVPHVVCCYRDLQQGDSRLVRLQELAEYPQLLAQGPIGQLMTSGVLERVVKTRLSPEAKVEQGQAWLDAFMTDLGETP